MVSSLCTKAGRAFLIVGAKKRKSVHHLVIREVMRFKEIRKDFVECSTLAARVYTAGIDEGRKDRIKVIFKIAGQAEKGYIFADIQLSRILLRGK